VAYGIYGFLWPCTVVYKLNDEVREEAARFDKYKRATKSLPSVYRLDFFSPKVAVFYDENS
jgi:hypothetical protein